MFTLHGLSEFTQFAYRPRPRYDDEDYDDDYYDALDEELYRRLRRRKPRVIRINADDDDDLSSIGPPPRKSFSRVRVGLLEFALK